MKITNLIYDVEGNSAPNQTSNGKNVKISLNSALDVYILLSSVRSAGGTELSLLLALSDISGQNAVEAVRTSRTEYSKHECTSTPLRNAPPFGARY